jgi:hypothetical protein
VVGVPTCFRLDTGKFEHFRESLDTLVAGVEQTVKGLLQDLGGITGFGIGTLLPERPQPIKVPMKVTGALSV